MKSIKIDQCDEGYLISDLELVGENGLKVLSRHAVSKDKLIQKVKELLGITDKSKAVRFAGKPKDRIDTLLDAAKDMAKKNPKPFISDSSDSTFPLVNSAMTSDVKLERPEPFGRDFKKPKDPSKIETKLSPSSPFVFKETAAFEVSVQPITTGKAIYWLHPGGKKIKIARKAYPSIFIHANISDLVYLYEHQAEAISIIQAYGKATYTNKAVVLRGFLKDVPLSALVGDNHNDDVVVPVKEEPTGQEDGSCDDVAFESCANNTPEQCKYCIDQSRYENNNKLAAKKPAPPLMKASVSP